MLATLCGFAIGIGLGWFSHRCQSVFVDICVALGSALSVIGVYAGFMAGEAYPHLVGAISRINEAGLDNVPVWTRISLAIPDTLLTFVLPCVPAALTTRLLCHIKARCYTDEPAPLTREQRRAKLWAEMNYSDELLD